MVEPWVWERKSNDGRSLFRLEGGFGAFGVGFSQSLQVQGMGFGRSEMMRGADWVLGCKKLFESLRRTLLKSNWLSKTSFSIVDLDCGERAD